LQAFTDAFCFRWLLFSQATPQAATLRRFLPPAAARFSAGLQQPMASYHSQPQPAEPARQAASIAPEGGHGRRTESAAFIRR